LPSAGAPHPPLDEHIADHAHREEIVRGRKLYAAPALPEHGDPHCRLDTIVTTHAATDRVASTDLITRVADDGDLATDTSIRRAGINPTTGERYLEEMVFEVVNTQRLSDVTAKAEELSTRGVRRVFAVFIRKGIVSEWRDDQWEALREDNEIVDECLAAPIPVVALLKASAVGAAAVRGLLARKEPELVAMLHEREAQGARDGRRAALRAVLAARGVVLTEAQRAAVDACDDRAMLDAWITRSASASVADDVFDEGKAPV
jgi:hypothetical protein